MTCVTNTASFQSSQRADLVPLPHIPRNPHLGQLERMHAIYWTKPRRMTAQPHDIQGRDHLPIVRWRFKDVNSRWRRQLEGYIDCGVRHNGTSL